MNGNRVGVGATPPPASLLQGASLFLDFDGTLVDISPTPDAVTVSAELRELLTLLQDRLGGRVAVLTGRSADDITARLHPVRLSVGGSHGLERRIAGSTIAAPERPAALDAAVKSFRGLERDFPGVLVEDKPFGAAVHYRLAPEAEVACHEAAEAAARETGLKLQHGKMVVELKPSGANKGAALLAMMDMPPFAGTHPIFLGDDLTDEPAFEASQQLGGAGVLVGEERKSAARYRLAGVADALAWMRGAMESLR